MSNEIIEIVVRVALVADGGCHHCVHRCLEEFLNITTWKNYDAVCEALNKYESNPIGLIEGLKECQGFLQVGICNPENPDMAEKI